MKNIEYKIENNIGILKFNREKEHNALNLEILKEIYEVLRKERKNANLRLMIVRGEGEKVFSSGVDLYQLLELKTISENRGFAIQLEKTTSELFRFPRPTIAMLNGYALGGGFGLAAACDYRIMTNLGKIGFPAVKIGAIMPVTCTLYINSLIGVGKSRTLMLTGRIVDAQEALRINLVDEIIEKSELEKRTLEVANEILRGSDLALQQTKKTVDLILQKEIEVHKLNAIDNFAYLSQTKEWRQRIKKFLNK